MPPSLAAALPNMVLLVADDIPRNMLGAYGAEGGLSPNIDRRLAGAGLTFERAYTTAPLCTPSRFTLLTGRYASNASSIPSHRPWNMVGFNTFLTGDEPTIAHRLQRAGYATCFCGKYHLGFPLPTRAGKSGGANGGRAKFGGSGRGLGYEEITQVVRQYGGFEETAAVWGGNKQTAQSPHNPEWMAAQAVAFVRRATARDAPTPKPFFLYFAGTVPHTPFALPASFEVNVTRTPAGPVPFEPAWEERRHRVLRRLVRNGLVCKDYRQCHGRASSPSEMLPEGGTTAAKYEGSEFRYTSMAYKRPIAMGDPWLNGEWLYTEPNFEQARIARHFVSGLAWLDDSIGTLLDALDESGAATNTIVAYTADHGASFMGKGHVYEAGIRVPLIVRWPQGIGTTPRRSAAPVALLDLAPTLLSAAAAESEAESLHGRSLLPLLRGSRAASGGGADAAAVQQDAQQYEQPIFIEIGYGRAVVRGPWKLVVVNDAIDRCRAPDDGSCRNLHGELIDRFQCNFTANNHTGNRVVGACNMTYDAVARHAGFCDRRQLYHTERDPLEQNNVVESHPELYDELLELIIEHAKRVEPSNPAIANQMARAPANVLRQCDRNPGGGKGKGKGGGGGGGGGARRARSRSF